MRTITHAFAVADGGDFSADCRVPSDVRFSPILVCPSFFGSRADGIGRVSAWVHQALAQLSHGEPYVLAANDAPEHANPRQGKAFGGNYVAMGCHAGFSPMFARWRDTAASARCLAPIVCTHVGLSPVARMLSLRLGRPYGVVLHGVEAWRPLRARDRWGLRGVSGFWANSTYTHRYFLRHNPAFAHVPVQVTPWGANPGETLPKVDKTAELPGFRLLCVSRLSTGDSFGVYREVGDLYKGFAVLLDALRVLKPRCPQMTLAIVGEGDARVDIEAYAADRGVADRVTFYGGLSEEALARQYREADAFVMPSEREGFGIVFAEAMARGLPCVGVAAGAVPEVIENGVSGWLVPPGDPGALADALCTLVENPRLRERMGEAGRRRFEREFTEAVCMRRLHEALCALGEVGKREGAKA